MMDRVRWSGESNGEAGMSRSPTPGEASTDEDGGIMLASAHPKKPAGRKKFKETRHPVYRGVRQRSSGKWVCEVREPQKKKSRIWLGTFPTPEMAARAHDVAAIALRGPGACLNFADSVHLPLPHSNDVKDIQRAAAQAANAFQAPTTTGSTAHVMSTHDQYLSPQPISTNNNVVVEQQQEQEQVFYMDEDAVFGMPGLLADMYHGMMLPPPPTSTDTTYYHHLEFDAELPLWSYSI